MLTRLKYCRFYCCGPMDHALDRGRGWRDDITPFLNSISIITLDPGKKPVDNETSEDIANVDKRKLLLSNEKYDELSTIMRPIRNTDLRMIDICDAVIAYLDFDVAMCGTWEEIFISNRQKKPILIVCKQGKNRIPPWMFAVHPHKTFFNSFEELKHYIIRVNNGEDNDTLGGRWCWFNYEELLEQVIN